MISILEYGTRDAATAASTSHTVKNKQAYEQKFRRIAVQVRLAALPEAEQAFLREKSYQHRFTLQELRQITEMALDFATWNEASIREVWPDDLSPKLAGKAARAKVIERIRRRWDALKRAANRYRSFDASTKPATQKSVLVRREKEGLGLGYCPVASLRTRCCNLMTLDAVENCGFDCSYCSIQSFYHDSRIYFDPRFAEKLNTLHIEPDRVYHIGTGQSSDSLMWGNKYGILDALTDFARRHPNVILEMKTKSKNVSYFLKHEVPKNIICTWSLNTPTIITHEEHLTASLEDRLGAARKVADRGILVGFHFHPMVYYDDWKQDYPAIFETIQKRFDPLEVALVSLGTLTFTKPVIRQIRTRQFKSKILQMPLVDANGKLSYPKETKLEMFRHAYNCLQRWHNEVFFYLCMENHRLWKPVFGYEYPSNEALEAAMKSSYMEKIRQAKAGHSSASRTCSRQWSG
ncbi:MAG: radical SAM protein [Gammaproteobacteria bacterium]|nr:radical SAM protein [Gammaproteobacteria bacterium]